MDRRNWLKLSRKLVDSTDMDYSFNAVQLYMAQNNLAFYGEGVLSTTTYPNPFPITLSPTLLSGVVGKGIAYDPTGYQTRIDDLQGTFAITPGDANEDRKDLLVLRYLAVGNTQIPEPDLPTQSVALNIVDGYRLVVIPGTPAGSPAYPAKGLYDIILAGLYVPQGTVAGSQVTIDLSVREIATPLRSFFPTFKQETPTGVVDGTNNSFALTSTPYSQPSALVTLDGVALTSSEWALSGNNVVLNTPPEVGQDVYVWYVVNSAGSVNPIAGVQETPTGTVDGTNATFNLSQVPVDQNSTQVYLNGLLEPITNWSLVQSPTLSQIVFHPGSVPDPGQDVYVFYLRNVVPAYGGGGGSGGGQGSISVSTEYPQLTGDDISNGFVNLMHTPIQPGEVLLDVIGAGAQAYGSDFVISGLQLSWLGDLQSELVVGDKLRIHYEY